MLTDINSLCVQYNCADNETAAKILISNIQTGKEHLEYLMISSNSDYHYFTSTSVKIAEPLENSFFRGLNTLELSKTPQNFNIPEGTYIVFLKHDSIKGTATSGNTTLNILDTKHYNAILFNTSGTLSLYSYLSEATCSFVVYSFNMSVCKYIITLGGDTEYSLNNSKTDETCIVSGFIKGSVSITNADSAIAKTNNADGSLNNNVAGEFTNPVYSILYREDNPKKLKHVINSKDIDKIEIFSNKSKDKAVYIHVNSSGILNTADWIRPKYYYLYTIPAILLGAFFTLIGYYRKARLCLAYYTCWACTLPKLTIFGYARTVENYPDGTVTTQVLKCCCFYKYKQTKSPNKCEVDLCQCCLCFLLCDSCTCCRFGCCPYEVEVADNDAPQTNQEDQIEQNEYYSSSYSSDYYTESSLKNVENNKAESSPYNDIESAQNNNVEPIVNNNEVQDNNIDAGNGDDANNNVGNGDDPYKV
ncbi:hypothetical protein TVAG_411310 [Trichomonas vaginalis G3]|uniref:Uncharacterized protein n=1 Tax=Trichomonas vaginalis (strain ATCC PRA-98 / G3) TaxID=412133 RepID=A2DXN6_TRIV3|nr:hypothetical protein TVAGG3_0047630 [Trichomonas vaginalis G3]EAY14865.1 hypothetical protein TVAG_411310 [Trichomonas vaginalis G3]KAI5541154.1 hypothetical protein TVAGG3_0047630 [Trichomonas vaginalis G3]|eukprot:XP_001327088.1 hypothetical protein [Trichomonas vaginalis G3]